MKSQPMWLRPLAASREWLLFIVERVAALLFGVIFLVNTLQIAARPINGGWIWVGDLSQLLFAWMIMLAAGVAYGRNDHIVVDFLIERVPRDRQEGAGLGYRDC